MRAADSAGSAALHVAGRCGHELIVSALLHHAGGSPGEAGPQGMLPGHQAAYMAMWVVSQSCCRGGMAARGEACGGEGCREWTLWMGGGADFSSTRQPAWG